MTLVELVIGKFPFPPNGQPLSVFELLEYIVNEPVPTLPAGIYSKEFEGFIAEWYVDEWYSEMIWMTRTNLSLIKDPNKRPGPSELLKHDYCVSIAAKEVDLAAFVKILVKD